MRKTTFLKFFLGNVIVIAIISCLFLSFFTDKIKQIYIKNGKDELHKICLSLYDNYKALILKGNQKKIDHLCKIYGKRLNVRITIIADDGTVLGDSYKDPKDMENHINRPEIKDAIIKGEGSSIRYSTTLDSYLVYNAVRITEAKKMLGFLRTSIFLKNINKAASTIKNDMKKTILFIFIASAFISLFLSRTLTMPIEDIRDKVSQIAKGNFRARITRLRKGELGELGRSINEMTERLEQLFENLKKEKERLRDIINSIPAGICLISIDGDIIMSNNTLKSIIGANHIEGKPYWESFKEPHVNLFIQEFKKELRDMEKEIEINSHPFLCSIRYIETEKKAILVFNDISLIKETERVKKDLIANISHELRTPITSIKGYVETLIEIEKDEEKKGYLSIIKRNAERLSNIISDLLMLSELDSEKNLNIEKVNLKDLIREIYDIFSTRLDEKKLSFDIYVDSAAEFIWVDKFRLEQALMNLIDNAIKYTKEGNISFRAILEKRHVKIEISDTGIGIPQEHIPRIFERFYVVDKSRSRKSTGTGLGLSIVRHIVELHNGKIYVNSIPDQGTTFTIILPQNQA